MIGLLAFLQVALLDIVLSGDNAVIIGALAASLPANDRRKVLIWGIALAIVLRGALSLAVVWLLAIPGIQIIGGAMLLWVAWSMWKDMRDNGEVDDSIQKATPKTFYKAMLAVVIADLSMSLDNVLAVAGAAKDHIYALVFGLILSMALMGVGASIVASLINRYRWISYIGLGLILIVAVRMIYHGILVFA